jgi:RND family efflux transporter MFP subunit
MNFINKIAIVVIYSVVLEAQEYIGIIKPIYDVKLSALVEGKIDKLFIKEGDSVKMNDKLLRIDDKLQKLEMNRREIIWKDKAQLSFAKKNSKILKSLLDSTQRLYNQTKAVSRDDLRVLKMKYYTAKGDIQAQIENEKREKIEYEMAKNILSQYTIVSPIDGIVTSIKKQESEWTKTGEVLLRIVNTDLCFLEINVDEKYANKVDKGKFMNFKIALQEKSITIKGKVIFVSPVADNSSGLVRLKIQFDNRVQHITPGISASINLD